MLFKKAISFGLRSLLKGIVMSEATLTVTRVVSFRKNEKRSFEMPSDLESKVVVKFHDKVELPEKVSIKKIVIYPEDREVMVVLNEAPSAGFLVMNALNYQEGFEKLVQNLLEAQRDKGCLERTNTLK
jgi:hypothetical protein